MLLSLGLPGSRHDSDIAVCSLLTANEVCTQVNFVGIAGLLIMRAGIARNYACGQRDAPISPPLR